MPDPWSEFLHAVGGVVHEAELLITGQKHIPLDLTVVGACLAAVGQDIARFGEHEVKVAHERFELVRSHVEGFHRAVQDASSTIGRIVEGTSREDTEKLPAELRDGIDDALQKLRSDSPEQAAARARDVRQADIKRSLDVVFKTTFDIFATHVHFLEVEIRAVLGAIRDALETVIIFVGDLEQQHPVLFRAVVVFLAVQLGSLIVPPLVGVLLSALGFGESGVVAGSTAAWIQSGFFGPAVPKGHIFGAMQAAGQTGVIPGLANLLGATIGGLIAPKL